MIRYLLGLTLLVHTFVLAESFTVVEDQATTEILSPQLKNRQVRKLKLANEMEVYLVSDPDADQSAAALSVEVGSWSDPKESPGMAHFLEHMLFLGTTKYPEESGYKKFLAEHGGFSNAYTTSDHTNYHFSVSHEAFEETLDRFAWFFKEPIFNPSGVEREMRAVDQEYAKNVENDAFRSLYVRKSLYNKRHPSSRFSIGSLETLSKISQEALQQWYKEHYSSNLMHLAIYSNKPIDELQELAVKMFSEVNNYHYSPLRVEEPLFDSSWDSTVVHVKPIKDLRSLSVMWELPPQFANMKQTRPGVIIGHLLGHEGKSSLLAQLKELGLADELSAGGHSMGESNYVFGVNITLTDKGLRSLSKVMGHLYAAIRSLKRDGIPKYVFYEVQTMQKLGYEWQERPNAYNAVVQAAQEMIEEDLATYPEQSRMIQQYSGTHLEQLVNALVPHKAQVTLLADPEVTGATVDRKEKWIGAEYVAKAISPRTLKRWKNIKPSESVTLPEKNPFLPESLEVVYQGESTTGTPHPKLLFDTDEGKIFYAPDTQYLVPKVSLGFEMKTPLVSPKDAKSVVMADLYVHAVNESLNTFSYPALLAGLNYSVSRTDEGISVLVSGYADKAELLLEEILASLKKIEMSEAQFKQYTSLLSRRYRNQGKEGPLHLGFEYLREILNENFTNFKEKYQALRSVTQEDFLAFSEHLFDHSYVEGMMYGSLTEPQAHQVWRNVKMALASVPFLKEEHYVRRVIKFSPDHGPYFVRYKTKQQGNSAVMMLAHGDTTLERQATLDVLTQWISEPFFTALRTKQQTAYIAYNFSSLIEEQLFSFFLVQSNTHDGRDLLSRFDLVLEQFLQELGKERYPESKFETVKEALTEQLEQPPRSLSAMATRLHTLAFEFDGDFDRIEKRVAAFKELKFSDFTTQAASFYGRENRERLGVLVDGALPEETQFSYVKLRSGKQLRKISDFNASPSKRESSLVETEEVDANI